MTISESDAIKGNLAHWDEVVDLHVGSTFYDTDAFRGGASVLDPLVRTEIGDVSGLSLCHLQCHFGLDTLSLARLGATVTGIDFSPKAIAAARALSAETGVPGTFVESTVYDAPAALDGARFDIVFTSWGALCWLPDMERWAQTVAALLKDGGRLYLADGHPLLLTYQEAPRANGEPLSIIRPYFQPERPWKWENEPDYAEPEADIENDTLYEWNHPISEVASAVAGAGLRIEFLHEHDFILWQALPELECHDDWYWRWPDGAPRMPLSYSLAARKT